jgi:Flp pilus assembly protein TadG
VRRDGEHGSAAVEFALLLPIVFLVLLAVVQVGVLASDQLVITQAARAGARAASVEAGDDAAREAAVGAAAGLDPARLTVTVSRSGTQGDPVTVAVAYEAPVAGLISGWLLPPEVKLQASSTMRQEFA